MPNDDIMTVKELADYFKIAEKTAYRFASEGKVPGFKVGRRVAVSQKRDRPLDQ